MGSAFDAHCCSPEHCHRARSGLSHHQHVQKSPCRAYLVHHAPQGQMHGPGMVQEGWERVVSCLLLGCPWVVLWARRPAPHSTHRSTPLLASWRNWLREKAGGWGLSFLVLSGGARRCSRKQRAIPRAHIPAARESPEHSFSQAPRHTSTASTLPPTSGTLFLPCKSHQYVFTAQPGSHPTLSAAARYIPH